MENGSLLSEALQYTQQLREEEHQLYAGGMGINRGHGNNNVLVLSMYCIDLDLASNPIDDTATRDDCRGDWNVDHKKLMRKLSTIHGIIHSKLFPVYEKRYKHKWFKGGEGLCFGMHCHDEVKYQMNATEDGIEDLHMDEHTKRSGGKASKDAVPHLRAVVHYGPHPLDEYYAIAIMSCISKDLSRHHNIRVGIECWDVDDGQILLIEGANHLPSWVDDQIGVREMANRVYLVEGKVVILPPSTKGQCGYHLSRREAIHALVQMEDKRIRSESGNETVAKSSDDAELHHLNKAIEKRLGPFCSVINHILDVSTKRTILGEYLHTAAIVLPLQLALMIRHRPDLIAIAISSFCQHATEKLRSTKESRGRTQSTQYDEGEMNDDIPFENLVFTSITIPKTLYAMLLTAAGQLPPPMKLPKHYKSIELKRMKRQCINGGVGYAHLRHSIEAGVRLSLGFEWIISQRKTSNISESKHHPSSNANSYSMEDRISLFMTRIDTEAGGDGHWLQQAWNMGPNATSGENDISSLVKCPVWNPEVAQGGISPISSPGKGLIQHLSESMKYARRKEEDSSSGDMSKLFPFPRASEVDSDKWLDLDSVDELEMRMRELVDIPPMATGGIVDGTAHAQAQEGAINDGKQDRSIRGMNAMLENLEKFVDGKSDIEGVATSTSPSSKVNKSKTQQRAKGLNNINSGIVLRIVHHTLKSESNGIRLDGILSSNSNAQSQTDDQSLLQYFSEKDLDLLEVDDEMDNSSVGETGSNDTNNALNDMMKTMDEELADERYQLDRGNEEYGDDDSKLSPDDSTAMRAKVLSNILESLDSQGGAPGPISTLLSEMKNS